MFYKMIFSVALQPALKVSLNRFKPVAKLILT